MGVVFFYLKLKKGFFFRPQLIVKDQSKSRSKVAAGLKKNK